MKNIHVSGLRIAVRDGHARWPWKQMLQRRLKLHSLQQLNDPALRLMSRAVRLQHHESGLDGHPKLFAVIEPLA